MESAPQRQAQERGIDWLGRGEMGSAIRAFDWLKTALGPISAWPHSLRTAVSICLNSRFPIFIWWGPDLINLYNDAYIPVLGKRHPGALGHSAREIWQDVWPAIASQVEAVLERGESSWQERVLLVTNRNGYPEDAYFTYSHSPVFDEDGTVGGLVCTVTEETARVLAERRQAFLLELSDQLRALTEPRAIMNAAVAALGLHLRANRVGYGQVQPDDKTIVLESSYVDGVAPLTGAFPLAGFGPGNIAQQRRGITVVHEDVASDSYNDPETWAAIEARSFVSVPLVRDGRFRASLYVNFREPHLWPPEEVSLIEDVAARTWDAIERARAEEERRKSEERLTFALEAGGGVGTWDCDVPADRLYCNARFAQLFSVDPACAATGAPISEYLPGIHPEDRPEVAEKVERAITTGGEYTAEYRVVLKNGSTRWLYARGRGHLNALGAPSRFTGVVFDVTERKVVGLRNAFLVHLDDVVRPLTDPHEITQAAAKLLGEYLQVNRCAYADVEEDEDTFNLAGDYNQGVDSIIGRYTFAQFGAECLRLMRAGQPYVVTDSEIDPRTERVRDSYRMTRIRSVICVPMLKQGRFVAAMAVHQTTVRAWQPDEVELVQQVANRCWESIERARIARELHEREQRYRFLAESIPQMVWTAAPDGALDYVNEQVARYFGTAPETVLGAGWLRWVHSEDQESTVERWKHALATSQPYEASFRLRRESDGSWRWHLVRALPLIGEDGRVRQWFGTCTDIEDEKAAEAQLRQQWHTFDTALSHTPDFTYTFDLEGRFTYVNHALLSLWQKSLDEARGKNFFELSYPADLAERLQRQIQQVIDAKEPVRDHTPFTGPTGETRHYEYIFVPVLGADGNVEAVAGSTRDITDRERIEQALAASEQKLQRVFAQAPVAIVVFRGREFVIELANPFYQDLVRRELVGRRLADAIPELSADVWNAFHRVLDTGEPFVRNEFYIPYDQDGDGQNEDHWFNVVYHPLREGDGSVSGLVAVCSDVTAQVAARQELERVNRELEEFAYVASHDLQEPIRMVNIYTQQILRRVDKEDTTLNEYAGFVRQGVTRMQRLIGDLLTYSRTVQRQEQPVGTAELSAALTEALAVMKERIEESKAIITADALPIVRGETAQLAHVFQNLISNALKYKRTDISPAVQISAEREGDLWVISVQDNGIGFEQQYAGRIFGLFKRLHKDEYPGTGLGLAICQRIIERYGGRIWAEGSPGQGACFRFALPQVRVQ